MPLYSWKGIDLFGRELSGKMRALSVAELEDDLRARDIGLLYANEKKVVWSSLHQKELVLFFERLALLLQSGVLLPAALSLVSKKLKSHSFATIVEELRADVERGMFLHEAMAAHQSVFDRLTMSVWRVGASGDMRGAMTLLCDYMNERYEIKKKLRRAALMPFLTFSFFVVIFFCVLLFVIPQFDAMFASLKVQIPPMTKTLVALSGFVCKGRFFLSLAVFSSGCFSLWWLRNNPGVKMVLDTLALKIPYLRLYVRERECVFFFNACGLLVRAGVQVVPALELACEVVENQILRNKFQELQESVKKGSDLSRALEELTFIDEEIIALIMVGEKTGKLGSLLRSAGHMCNERMQIRIDFLLQVIQPLLILMLAVMIVGLMLAVYMPIFTLSNTMM